MQCSTEQKEGQPDVGHDMTEISDRHVFHVGKVHM